MIDLINRTRQSKVAHLHFTAWPHEAVGWLDVTVQNAVPLRGLEAVDDLQRVADRLVDWERPHARHLFFERAAIHEFHRDDWEPVDLFRAVHVDRVRMVDRRRRAAFAQEAFAIFRATDPRCEHLHRDLAPIVQLLGGIHRPHAAPSQQAFDAVTAEDGAGRKVCHP